MTSTIESGWTLNEVISAKPGLAARLEGLGLDYCCHGDKTVEFACNAAGLDTERIVAELNKEASPADRAPWITMSLSELVDHVVTEHHMYMWEEMPRLSALMAKVHSVHGMNHPELAKIREVYEAVRAEFEPHLTKEERVIFPAIKKLDAATAPIEGSLDAPLKVLVSEHEAAGELLDQLRDLTNGFQTPADGCASYQALFAGLQQLVLDTHLHVHKENHRMFPAAIDKEEELARAATPA